MSNLFAMPKVEPSDAEARRQALDIERSWIVEAPAGSGKTGLLIQRYLRLLGAADITEAQQVLAITFTRAAAEEIRERVLRELQRAQDGVEPSTDYDRKTRALAHDVLLRDNAMGWRLLDEPHRLRVRTIDSLCAEIARSLPILCGGDGLLTPVEEPLPLYEEAARRTWLHLGDNDTALGDALRTLLLHRDGDLAACISLIAEILSAREQWGSLVPLRAEDLADDALELQVREQLDRTLGQVVADELERLAKRFPEKTLARLIHLAVSLSDRPGYTGQPSPIAVLKDFRGIPAANAEHLVYWRALIHLLIKPSTGTWRTGFNKNHLRFEMSKKDRTALQEILREVHTNSELLEVFDDICSLPPATFPAEQWPVTKALFHVLRQALIELQLVFRETSKCDFAEPALLARYALSQNGGLDSLDRALGTELKHLLVDEMQDTSTRQYELIERLTEGWEDEQKTVFLVGDPKQSIYLFRQARVERFNETMRSERLGQLPVGLLQLTANFRSQAGLVSAFNQDFSRIFPADPVHAEDVSYAHVTATRKLRPNAAGEEGAAWHLSLISGDTALLRPQAQAQKRRNAHCIRQVIKRWQDRPLPEGRTDPWTIAVLVQSRGSLATVLPELRQPSPIALRALKIDPLSERPEVLDLLALTRALLHPSDRTAWLAVLRAPWCGLGLADLHVLTGKDDATFLNHTMLELILANGTEVSSDGMARLRYVWPVLEAAIFSSSKVRVPEQIERTWRSLGGNTFLNQAALKNAEEFFVLLRAIDHDTGSVTLADLSQRLLHLYASPEASEGAVDLATIHSSKGLEWDVVLIPELERRAPSTAPRLFEWEELLTGNVVLAPIMGKGQESASLNRWLCRIRARREKAERKRLFYVACTRAREEFHLFGIAFAKQNGTVGPRSGSLLEAAWPAAELRRLKQSETALPRQQDGGILSSIAASAGDEMKRDSESPVLQRLPLSSMPIFALKHQSPVLDTHEPSHRTFFTQEAIGSFSARCLGMTVHTFLEETANRLQSGTSISNLLCDLPAWEPRIRALLRSHGLPPRSIGQHLLTVIQAVRTTLSEPVGQWLLGSGNEARNELALATQEESFRQHRIDRVFRAGSSPGEIGDAYLWIIDYKTSSYSGKLDDSSALQEFFSEERTRHAAQLERYSSVMDEKKTRLGLWFPLIGKFTWWES